MLHDFTVTGLVFMNVYITCRCNMLVKYFNFMTYAFMKRDCFNCVVLLDMVILSMKQSLTFHLYNVENSKKIINKKRPPVPEQERIIIIMMTDRTKS